MIEHILYPPDSIRCSYKDGTLCRSLADFDVLCPKHGKVEQVCETHLNYVGVHKLVCMEETTTTTLPT
jgi:hypothetical protein